MRREALDGVLEGEKGTSGKMGEIPIESGGY